MAYCERFLGAIVMVAQNLQICPYFVRFSLVLPPFFLLFCPFLTLYEPFFRMITSLPTRSRIGPA